MAAHQLPASSRKRSRRVLGRQTTKQLQRFYGVEVFRPQPPIPGSQGSETVSLPCGTSAFYRGAVYHVSQPYVRRRAKPFNSHTVSISSPSKPTGCAWSIHRAVQINALALLLAYLLGSIPFGYLIVRLASCSDIRETGSGGTGATNVSRRAGKAAGVAARALHALK